MPEFSNTDAELYRLIKARVKFELEQTPNTTAAIQEVREYMHELLQETTNHAFKSLTNNKG